jgi:hypothetical protein
LLVDFVEVVVSETLVLLAMVGVLVHSCSYDTKGIINIKCAKGLED